jgi:hypothetical protein
VLDAVQMAREQRMAEQGYAGRTGVAVLEDENGQYTLQIREGIIFNDYQKTYISGPKEGTTVELGFFEFLGEAKKRNAKYGYFNWLGEYVPGEVPPIYIPGPPPGDMI